MDDHALIAILAFACALSGILLTGYLLEHQDAIAITLDETGQLPDHTVVRFQAKIDSFSFSKTGTKLELSDLTTIIIAHSDEFLELEEGQLAEFVASIESQNGKKQLQILRVIPND